MLSWSFPHWSATLSIVLAQTSTLAVELSGVRRVYTVGAGEVRALDGLSLTVPGGQFLAIVGPSGSGKSTLLSLLGGLDRPDEGQITVEGQELGGLRSHELARFRQGTVGFVFQSFNLLPNVTALDNVGLPMIFAGVDDATREKRARELLELVGLAERAHHRASQLSGGEQQRVAVARALANNPRVLLADEPTGNLDSETGQRVMQMLAGLHRQQGLTLVVVTHNQAVAQGAQRIVRLRDGRVVEDVEGRKVPA